MQKRLIITRYIFRELILTNQLFTVLSAALIYSYNEKSFVYVFWLKVVGFLFSTWMYLQYRKNRLFFFHNLGVSKTMFFTLALLIDTIISIILFLTVLLLS
ncbi:MAG: hypothetical protein RIM99_02420 [Cyclobacteriaceae bacterium]